MENASEIEELAYKLEDFISRYENGAVVKIMSCLGNPQKVAI